MRSGQSLLGSATGHILPDWRRGVFGHFLALLEKNQYIPWGNILKRVGEAVQEGRITLPGISFWLGMTSFPMEETPADSMAEDRR
jgi:hypothetical protein